MSDLLAVCKFCKGDGWREEGDPEIGSAVMDCNWCGGTGIQGHTIGCGEHNGQKLFTAAQVLAFAKRERERLRALTTPSAFDGPATDTMDADWPAFKALAKERGWSVAEAGKAWAGWKAHRAAAPTPVEPAAPLDTPLPVDFTAAGATFRKGLPLRLIAKRIERLREAAYGPMPTPEQQAANLAILQGREPAEPVKCLTPDFSALPCVIEHCDRAGRCFRFHNDTVAVAPARPNLTGAAPFNPTPTGSLNLAHCGCSSWTDGLGGTGEFKCEAHRALAVEPGNPANQAEPDCWAILTPNRSKLVSPEPNADADSLVGLLKEALSQGHPLKTNAPYQKLKSALELSWAAAAPALANQAGANVNNCDVRDTTYDTPLPVFYPAGAQGGEAPNPDVHSTTTSTKAPGAAGEV